MNEVYLNKNGRLFVNGNEIKDVISVASKTDYEGTKIVIEIDGNFTSDYQNDKEYNRFMIQPFYECNIRS
ncbi:hypothetical protein [Longicatena caecimuris]|uniref:Uncharacterized protein n=1 Tax=Longicatena caecimuris TaxID=1796635 RepID=A0A4R3TDB1_9FIRM|nr:hypothetical protein [Longicatena caecimuris]MCR1870225.1 hypothetical protein [Longicatena caecimuris]MCU0102742.1 hypothetical protein [Longicatena caecimuris]TCU59971.1 hypothetical protein EDD61_1098 [Longicatena caecimuris]